MGYGTIAGYLAQWGLLYKQGEVLCTHGLTYLLEEPAASAALVRLLAERTGVDLPSEVSWVAEVSHPETAGRVDLEAQLADGTPVVEIEAKLWANLDCRQLHAYATHVASTHSDGVLAVLMPPDRVDEAVATVRRCFAVQVREPGWRSEDPAVHLAVLDWETVLDRLEGAVGGLHAENVRQLRGMYRSFMGPPPPSPCDAPEFEIVVVDRVTRVLTGPDAPVMPMGLERATQGGYRRRYLASRAGGGACFSIGTCVPFGNETTRFWMRYHQNTPGIAAIYTRLLGSPAGSRLVADNPHLWIPLDLPDGNDDDGIIEALVEQARSIDAIAAAPPTPVNTALSTGPEVEWVEVEVHGRRYEALCTLNGVTARAIVDQSPADGSWVAYALRGDWHRSGIHQRTAGNSEESAKAAALDAAWQVLESRAFDPDA